MQTGGAMRLCSESCLRDSLPPDANRAICKAAAADTDPAVVDRIDPAFLRQDVSLPALAIQEDSQSAYTQQYTQALTRQTEAHLADALLEQLEAAGVACQKVQVEIHIDQQGGIDIREVRLQCADFQAAVTQLHRTLGADITITEVDVW